MDRVLLLIDATRASGSREAAADYSALGRGLSRHRLLATSAGVPQIAVRVYLDLSKPGRPTAAEFLQVGVEPIQALTATPTCTMQQIALDALEAAQAGVRHLAIAATSTSDYVALYLRLRARGVGCTFVALDGRVPSPLDALGITTITLDDLVPGATNARLDEDPVDLLDAFGAAVREVLGRRGPTSLDEVIDQSLRSLNRPVPAARLGVESLEELVAQRGEELGVQLDPESETVQLLGVQKEGRPSHDVYEYRRLLRARNPRVHLTAREDWQRLSEIFFACASGSGAVERPVLVQKDLCDEVVNRANELGIDSADKKVQAIVFQMFKSGAFFCAAAGAEGETDFHWAKPARLRPEIQTVEQLRDACRVYIARILMERLRSDYGSQEVDVDVFAELLEGSDCTEERLDAVEELLDRAEAQIEQQLQSAAERRESAAGSATD